MLQGKKLVLGITGSIAAYKAVYLLRMFQKQGAEVRILMTPDAASFISPLTLATLSGHPVGLDFQQEGQWTNHVEWGRWGDVMVLAPLTANTLAHLAHGFCDNFLLAVYFSAPCPVFLAPAMDEDMWNHPATQSNLNLLIQRGNHLIPVGYGELASGLIGDGRMAEPEDIIAHLTASLSSPGNAAASQRKALVTAGPTHEPIDPVRFIGNSSSGKMGIALADALARSGFAVDLVLGPSHLAPGSSAVRVHRVTTADEMHQKCLELFPSVQVAVLSAAVADYRPAHRQHVKIKKVQDQMQLDLVRNPDILKELGQLKVEGQFLVGFSLETDREEENTLDKMQQKNADAMVLNSLNEQGAGFSVDTNKITLFGRNGYRKEFPLKSKIEVAQDIVDYILEHYGKA